MNPTYVMDEEWDYLIILDACRYDYFNQAYKDFFEEGTLKKVESPAIETLEWAQKNFTDFYDDVIYISTTPFINSSREISKRGYHFDAKKHFYKILDAWDWGWDNKIKTVRPETVNKALLKELSNYPDKKFIIHYMQPHAPYFSLESYYKKMDVERRRKKDKTSSAKKGNSQIKQWALQQFMNVVGTKGVWQLNKYLHFRDVMPSHMEMAWRIVGEKGLRIAYKKNLEHVLNYVKKLLANLDGNVIITADHGELLWEKRYFGHGKPLPRHENLVTIPWFELRRG